MPGRLAAVVADEGELSVVRHGDFMRAFSGGDLTHDFSVLRIDDHQRGIFLIQNDESRRWHLRLDQTGGAREPKQGAESGMHKTILVGCRERRPLAPYIRKFGGEQEYLRGIIQP